MRGLRVVGGQFTFFIARANKKDIVVGVCNKKGEVP
jgi:hypothetical protein